MSLFSSKLYICKCGKEYNHASGLSRHKNKCYINQDETEEQINTKTPTTNTAIDKEFMVKMFKEMFTQNKDVINKMMEIIPLIGNSTVNTNNNSHNTTNNQFNIQMFLNEHCKNAMNLTDFMDTLKVSVEDLMYTKDHGYVKGISNIILKQL